MNDLELLRQYLANRDQRAFEQLAGRHLDWVYSAALRQVGDAHLAEDVTQAVFLALCQQASRLAEGGILTAWLFQVTRNASITALRSDSRRRKHEREAAAMAMKMDQGMSEQEWHKLAGVLDEAVEGLGKKDRLAVLMRFYEKKSFAEIGSELGISEDAAQKRVMRALGKLREMLGEKGLAVSAAALGAGMLANTTQAAPAGLAGTVLATATAGIESAGVVGGIAKGAVKMMAWAKVKFVAVAIVLLSLPILAGVLATRYGMADAAAAPGTTTTTKVPIAPDPNAVMVPDGEAIIERVRDRLVNGYGNYLALLTQERRFPNGQLHWPFPREVTFFGRDGANGFSLRYLITSVQAPADPRYVVWPADVSVPQQIDAVLPLFARALPWGAYVVNGNEAWNGFITDEAPGYRAEINRAPKQTLTLHSVGGLVWPQFLVYAQRPGTTVRVLTSKDRPQLIAVQYNSPPIDEHAPIHLPAQRTIYWLDPQRDDMPVEVIHVEDPPKNGEILNYRRTVFKEYAQLPGGRWYPTLWWHEEFKGGAKVSPDRALLTRLQLFPGAKVDAEWYGDPAKRFTPIAAAAATRAATKPAAKKRPD